MDADPGETPLSVHSRDCGEGGPMGIVVYAAVTVAVFAVLGLAQKLVEKL